MKTSSQLLTLAFSFFVTCILCMSCTKDDVNNSQKPSPEPVVEEVSLNETEKKLLTGDSFSLKASINGREITDQTQLEWKSSNSSVASVSYGKVSALSNGETTIIVSIKGTTRTASCKILVSSVSINTEDIKNITPFNGDFHGQIICDAMESINLSNTTAGVLLVHEDQIKSINQCGWDINHTSQLRIADGDKNVFIVIEATSTKIKSNGEFDVWLYSLLPETKYYYRAFVQLPNKSVYYGEIKDVTTPAWDHQTNYAVDLGLSVKWAPVNVRNNYGGSAVSYEKIPAQGTTFAWGEAWGKYGWGKYNLKSDVDGLVGNVSFDLSTYDPKNDGTGVYDDIGSNISGTEYDHATNYWGSNWRMPTKEEWEELKTKCSWKKLEHRDFSNRVYSIAWLVTGSNGKSIFLPACYHSIPYNEFKAEQYWSATIDSSDNRKAFVLTYEGKIESAYRYSGNVIRAVTNKQSYKACWGKMLTLFTFVAGKEQ